MGEHLDRVPFSGIIRIRDMMYSVTDPFRLDQGDVSFDAPDTVKRAMHRAIDENHSHYLQTTGVPRLLELLAAKLRAANGIPVGDARRSDGDDRRHPCAVHRLPGAARAGRRGRSSRIPSGRRAWETSGRRARVPVPCPLHEALGWRYDLAELESTITPKTRAIYINSPHNPTGGVLTRQDVEAIAAPLSRSEPVAALGRGVRRRAASTAPSTSARRRSRTCTTGRSRCSRSASRTR